MNLKIILTKTKIILIGVIFVLSIIIFGLFYSYYKFDKNTINAGPIMESRLFQILKKFKDNNVDFNNLPSMVSQAFNDLQDHRSYVEPIGNGRSNPFAP